MTTSQQMLSPRQVAQKLRITLYSVYYELWANRLPGAQKVGKTWRIPLAAVEARLNGKKDLENGFDGERESK